MQLSLLNYGVEMFKGDACSIARIVASKTCAQVYTRLKQLLPALAPDVPKSPAPGHKRKSSGPQKRKNATLVGLSVSAVLFEHHVLHCHSVDMKQLLPALTLEVPKSPAPGHKRESSGPQKGKNASMVWPQSYLYDCSRVNATPLRERPFLVS